VLVHPPNSPTTPIVDFFLLMFPFPPGQFSLIFPVTCVDFCPFSGSVDPSAVFFLARENRFGFTPSRKYPSRPNGSFLLCPPPCFGFFPKLGSSRLTCLLSSIFPLFFALPRFWRRPITFSPCSRVSQVSPTCKTGHWNLGCERSIFVGFSVFLSLHPNCHPTTESTTQNPPAIPENRTPFVPYFGLASTSPPFFFSFTLHP